LKDLIFIDELGVNWAIIRLYARSLKGSKTREIKPSERGKNVSIIGAISVNKGLTLVNLTGTIDAIKFDTFIIRKLVSKLCKGTCVVMDNRIIHTKKNKKSHQKERGKINILVALLSGFVTN